MKQYKEDKIKQNKKQKKNEIKNAKENKKLKNASRGRFLKYIIFIFLLALISLISFLFFKAYTFKNLAKEMFNNSPTNIFDSNKNAIAQIGAERNRQNVSFSDIPENLKNAYVSIEDQRFYKHHGVDIKRTGAAIFSYVIKRGSSSFGGSTISQQLVKNLTGDDSNSISRKVKEWFYAIVLDSSFSKDEILEAYLNIIYTGPNIYGVKEASNYYFSCNLNELTLAKCAFLAGINNSPNSYNPFSETDKSEKISKRTKTVLNKMLELNYISQSEYDEAIKEVENGISFKKGTISNNIQIGSYHTDALINEVIADFASKNNISKDFSTNYFYLSGSSIYSTQNDSIQNVVEKECKNKKYILKSSNSDSTSQTAVVIIDQSTGYVIACSGGLGEKTKARGFNRATQMKRQTGSAMKPIAVLAPAIDKKLVTNVTVFADEPTTFTDYNGESYSPVDYDNYKGSITLRQAVESSQNIPFVKIMQNLTPEVSIKYLEKMGITTLNDKDVNLSLSLGGLDEGISPLEFAGAYATIANDGVYIEPTFFTKIETNSGKTILTSHQTKKRVISKDSAFILKQLLTEPVTGSSGTATYCSISGMDVSAKTGTTNENYDRWLCGFTPYYTAVCWFGFDMNETINFNGKNPAGLIWSSIMKNIHSNLPGKRYEITSGVVTRTICKDSGKVANSNCPHTFTEYFLKDTVPENCTQHSGTNLNANKNKENSTKTTTPNSNTNTTKTQTDTPSSSTKNESSYVQENNDSYNNSSLPNSSNLVNQNNKTTTMNESNSNNNITKNTSNQTNTSISTDAKNTLETENTSPSQTNTSSSVNSIE